MSTDASSPTPTPTDTSTSSSPTPTGYTYGTYWGGGAGFSSTWVTWVSVVVVAGVVLALLCSRYFYIRRFYSPTFRAYFIPPKGIHIRWLNLHIAGPPQRIPREPPPSYSAAARRRRRRGRQTAGETVADGGRRIGDRDADDGWDDLDMVERGGGASTPGIGGVGAVPLVDELPRYYVDSGLPGYFGGDGDAADEAERIRAEAAAAGESSVLPSAAEYEAAVRAGRDPHDAQHPQQGQDEAGAVGPAQPAYPPAAHLSPQTASDLPRPAAPARSNTARSALLLSAFRRAPSPNPEPPLSAAPLRGSDTADAPHASSSTSSLDDAHHHGMRALHRTASSSSVSLSSASTKLDGASVRKGKRAAAGEEEDGAGADASSSRVKLDDEGAGDAEKPSGRKDGDA